MEPVYCILIKNGNKHSTSPAPAPSQAHAMSKETPLSPSPASSSQDPSSLKDSSVTTSNEDIFGDDLVGGVPQDPGKKLLLVIELHNH